MNELAKEILDTVEVGALATVNVDRTPLVTPLHFARLGDSIVWISEPTARHSENAFRNGKAEFVVWDDKKRAVFLKTNVTELSESEKDAAMLIKRSWLILCRVVKIRKYMLHRLVNLMKKLQRVIGCILLHKHYI